LGFDRDEGEEAQPPSAGSSGRTSSVEMAESRSVTPEMLQKAKTSVADVSAELEKAKTVVTELDGDGPLQDDVPGPVAISPELDCQFSRSTVWSDVSPRGHTSSLSKRTSFSATSPRPLDDIDEPGADSALSAPEAEPEEEEDLDLVDGPPDSGVGRLDADRLRIGLPFGDGASKQNGRRR